MHSSDLSPARAAITMLRRALKGALGTLRAADGHPYVSMVLVSADVTGRPTFLLSSLAVHTQNILANPAASLLIDETSASGDVAAGSRVTFIGHVHATDDPVARSAFLARHPSAETYASFADFHIYSMSLEGAHLIQGFGRIIAVSRDDLLDACA